MNNEELQNIKDLIDDMRERAASIKMEGERLIEKAKIIDVESHKVENHFQHLLYPIKGVDNE